MLNDFTQAEHIYVACGYTDLRKGIDGFALLVKEEFSLDPFSRSLFLFCGKRNDRIKALYWEGDGFVLLYKRLERGSFQWPRSKDAMRTLTERQYRWLMEGLNIEQPRDPGRGSGPPGMRKKSVNALFPVSFRLCCGIIDTWKQ